MEKTTVRTECSNGVVIDVTVEHEERWHDARITQITLVNPEGVTEGDMDLMRIFGFTAPGMMANAGARAALVTTMSSAEIEALPDEAPGLAAVAQRPQQFVREEPAAVPAVVDPADDERPEEPEEVDLGTSGGVPVTEKVIEDAAAEAAQGYEPEEVKPRQRKGVLERPQNGSSLAVIEAWVEAHGGSVTEAARPLGVTANSIYNWRAAARRREQGSRR